MAYWIRSVIIVPANPNVKLSVWETLLRVAEEVEATLIVEVIEEITD